MGTEMESLLVDTKGAAAMLGMSVRGFRRAVKRTGTLKKHPASSRFKHLYSRARVRAWADEVPPGAGRVR